MKTYVFLAMLLASEPAMAQTAGGYTPPWGKSGGAAFEGGHYTPPWKRTGGSPSESGSSSSSAAASASTSASSGAAGQGGFQTADNNGGPPPQGGPDGEHRGRDITAVKAEITQRMTQHIAEMQQRLACVQAAATPDALRACLPERRGRGGGEGGGPEDHARNDQPRNDQAGGGAPPQQGAAQ